MYPYKVNKSYKYVKVSFDKNYEVQKYTLSKDISVPSVIQGDGQ